MAVTSETYQPFAPSGAAGATLALMVGGVRSMRIGPTVAVAVFPALSSAVPTTLMPASGVSALRVHVAVVLPSTPLPLGALARHPFGLDLIPTPASAQLKVTVTAVLFQPFAFGGGAAAPLIVAGSVSTMKLWLAVAELPARSAPLTATAAGPSWPATTV